MEPTNVSSKPRMVPGMATIRIYRRLASAVM
jgi:hypothetical protein